MSGVRKLHFLKDWWKFIRIYQYYYYGFKVKQEYACWHTINLLRGSKYSGKRSDLIWRIILETWPIWRFLKWISSATSPILLGANESRRFRTLVGFRSKEWICDNMHPCMYLAIRLYTFVNGILFRKYMLECCTASMNFCKKSSSHNILRNTA